MANAKFSVGQSNLLQHLLVIAREVGDPGTEAARQSFAPPHPTNINMEFFGLNPTTHYFDFRASVNGIDLGTLLATFTIDVGKINDFLIEILEFEVDRGEEKDPENGDDEYVNADLKGQAFIVFKPGYGPLSKELNIQELPDGGFKFIDEQTFQTGERYMVTLFKKVLTQVTETGKAFPQAIIEVQDHLNLDATHHNKEMEVLAYFSPLLNITFPMFSTIPEGTKFGFNTHKGNVTNTALLLPTGASCWVNGVQRNVIYMGKGETLIVIKKGAQLKIEHWDGDYRRVGEIVYQEKAPINGKAQLGGWNLKNEYKRFFYWYINELDPAVIGNAIYPAIPDAENITKFIISGDYFWMPDTGGRFIRETDPDGNIDVDRTEADRKPGTNQAMSNAKHSHFSFKDNGNTNQNLPISPNNYPAKKQGNKAGTDNVNYEYNVMGSTSQPDSGKTSDQGAGTDSRPYNYNQNAYRII